MNGSEGDRRLIVAFCILAAVRVFIYAAAFPFFNNVDEVAHFDLVTKYGRGHIPRSLEAISPEAATYIVRYGSPEYLGKLANFPDQRVPPPMWKQPQETAQRDWEGSLAAWRQVANHEASQPPLYYLIAGLWTDVGSLFGLKGGWVLYWVRFLNVLLAAALVWIAYLAALRIFPENRFMVLGVPLLAAVLPQDTYYSIQSDVLSPLCFGLVFVNAAAFLRAEVPDLQRAVPTGLTLAATILVKTSNLPLLAVTVAVVALKARRLSGARKRAAAALPLAEFAICALAPVLIWFLWNLSTYGDLTGTARKIAMLGWMDNPVSNWFRHPIFRPRGAWIFWSELMASFWRGELVWFGARLAMPAADVFYWLSSLILVGVAMIGLGRAANDLQRRMTWFAFWSFASLVIFMGLLSVGFDFGKCFYPSQAHPYFTSGRLVSAALIPFLLLYVRGLDRALAWIKSERWRLGVLAGIALFVTVSEIIVNRPAFSSQYNLFHLLGS